MAATHKAKNVLVILTDQQRAPELFAEENEGLLKLPAMRRLRRHGMSFRYSFCNTCMCSPSRSTFFTGKYPAEHGVTDTLTFGGRYSEGEHQLDNSIHNMGNMFAANGYDTQYRGKWHLSKNPNDPQAPDALTSADVALYGFKGWIPPDAGEDALAVHFGGGWPNQDAVYIQQAIDYIKEWKKSAAAARIEGHTPQPFFLVLSLVNPHDVLAYPNNWQYGYSEKDFRPHRLKLPPSWTEDLRTNHKPSAQWQLLAVMAKAFGDLPTEGEKKNYINFYGKLCEKIDNQINSVLDLFYDGDNPNVLFQNTVIFRGSDHGEMGMAHGGLRQKTFNVYEESIRVPMIWSNPEWYPDPRTSDSLISLIDVMPTMASKVLGLSKPKTLKYGFRGTDMSDVLDDPHVSKQDQILFTYDDVRAGSANQDPVVLAPNRIRCLRTKRWKYAVYFSADSSYQPQYEFYDLETETGEYGIEYQNLYYDHADYPHWKEAEEVLKILQHDLDRAIKEKLTLLPLDPANPIGDLDLHDSLTDRNEIK